MIRARVPLRVLVLLIVLVSGSGRARAAEVADAISSRPAPVDTDPSAGAPEGEPPLLTAAIFIDDPPADGRPPARADTLEDGRPLLVEFNFGPRGRRAPRQVAFAAHARHTKYGWYGGMIIDRRNSHSPNPLLRDVTEGEDATFVVGVAPADSLYRVELILGDISLERGTVTVHSGGQRVAEDVAAPTGKTVRVVFETRPVRGRLDFRIEAEDCRSFAIAAARIWGPAGATMVDIFPGPDMKRPDVPHPDSLLTLGRVVPRTLLRRHCEFLMEQRLHDGGFSYRGAWYQNSFALRTLLAGSTLLLEPEWRDAAVTLLDRFVADQAADGSWLSAYFGRRGCEMATRADASSANLADIGAVTLCLAMAVPLVDTDRQEEYLRAAILYADSVALPNQLPDGAFANRLWSGRDWRHPYSIATATQASSLALLYAITEEPHYLESAERAARFLARNVRSDGRIALAPHDTSAVEVIESTAFGDVFYVIEALLIVERYTVDPRTRRELSAAVDRWMNGKAGLMARAEHGYWWRVKDSWTASKLAGVPYLIALQERQRRTPELALLLRRQLAWLADLPLSRRIGVRLHPAHPSAEYALTATGFGGMSVAAFIDPYVLLPMPEDHRPVVAKLEEPPE
jgi:hypothetical protein